MLMSDTWQPAVLQLLPFSSNDASSPQPPSSATPRLRPLPLPDHTRGFPVLAVTRRDKEGGASETFSPKGRGQSQVTDSGAGHQRPSRSRPESDRMTRSHTFVDTVSSSNNRAKSEYYTRRSGASAVVNGKSNSYGATGSHQSRDQATCSITDINDRIMSRVARRPEGSSSPDSGSGSVRNSPYMTSASAEALSHHGGNGGGGGGGGGVGGGSGRGFPKPSFPSNALSPNNITAAGVIGTGNGSGNVGEGRYQVSKNGMWRSVTLTPGELELKKHRDMLERVNTAQPTLAAENKTGRQYHKMNVRDLPRSTTPVNDHDPDKLNMKQVIAFLQSKGKSQADAVELPRGMKGKDNQAVAFPRTVQSGALRGSVRRSTASSTSAEIIMRSPVRRSLGESGDASPSSAQRRGGGGGGGGEGGGRDWEGEAVRASSTSLPPARQLDKPGGKSWRSAGSREQHRDGGRGGERREQRDGSRERHGEEFRHHGQERPDAPHKDEAVQNSSKPRKKPFRLHRFLTMVPSARELPVTSASFASSTSRPTYSAGPPAEASYSPSRSAQKERTLCLDLAWQSKSQAPQSRGDAPEAKQSLGKVHYRLAAARPRPSSLHVEQDVTEAQCKLSADFGDRDATTKTTSFAYLAQEGGKREDKNVIRLPFVMVDSEDEEITLTRPESRGAPARSRTPKYAQHTRSSSRKTEAKNKHSVEMVNSGGGGDADEHVDVTTEARWALEEKEKETQGLLSSSQVSASSSMLPAPTRSTSSMLTASCSDILSDQAQASEDSVDNGRLPELAWDTRHGNIGVNNGVGSQPGHGSWNNNNIGSRQPGQNNWNNTASGLHGQSSRRVNVKVNMPSNGSDDDPRRGEDVTDRARVPDRVTLSLRKEPHRTRERTYMSEIGGGSDAFSDDTCAARVNSESVRMSLKSDDMTSWAS